MYIVICLVMKALELRFDLSSWIIYFVLSKDRTLKENKSLISVVIGIPPPSAGSSLGSLKGSVPSEGDPRTQSGNKSNLSA